MEIKSNAIVLLDLNYTLVANQAETRHLFPFAKRLEKEEYRFDLIEKIKEHKVIIISARPAWQGKDTLQNILQKTGWQPDGAYFNEHDLDPPSCKERILHDYVFPLYGEAPDKFYALESNPKTRVMYARYGIEAHPYETTK